MRVSKYMAALLLSFVILGGGSAQAEDYPTKPIRFIVPFNPGGSYDVMARLIGDKLTKAWNQQIVVENRPGTGSLIGTEEATRAEPDGYTLVMFGNNHAVLPNVHVSANFDVQKDFAPVALLAKTPYVLLVNPSLPVKNLSELIELAKSKPGELNYGSGGVGSITHLGTEMFLTEAGIKVVHIPYKAGVPATMDLVAGQTQVGLLNILSAKPLVESGKLRALAIATDERSPLLPDVMTMAEAGLPQFRLEEWYAVVVPTGTPEAIVSKLNDEINKILAMPEVKKSLSERGVSPVQSEPADFAKLLADEIARNAKAVKQAGIKTN